MPNKKYTVEITTEESETVERLFYEHKAGQENIKFLMKDREVNYSVLQEYIDVVEARYVEFELMKGKLGEKYKPEEIGDQYNFTFDFDNHAIVYEEVQ